MATRHAAKLRLSSAGRIHTQLRNAIALEQHDTPRRHSAAYRFRLRQPRAYAASRGERIYGWIDPANRPTTPRPLSPTTPIVVVQVGTPPHRGEPLPAALSAYAGPGTAAGGDAAGGDGGDGHAAHLLAVARATLSLAGDFDTPNICEQHMKSYMELMERHLQIVADE